MRLSFRLTVALFPVLLIAIRQGENGHDLLEKTVLKLRVDQKGNGLINVMGL